MRPEFKEALDSYEDFFRKYCDIMKKYANGSVDLGFLADYAEYTAKYADIMSKLEAMENDDLNDAELAYYVEVHGRITQMLLEVAV